MEGRRKDGWTEKKENLNPELENTESKEYRI